MMLFDSHAHYDDARFSSEYEGGCLAALRDAKREGVCFVVNAGSDLASSRRCIEMAELSAGDDTLPSVYAAVGIHPTETSSFDSLDAAIQSLREAASCSRVTAIGEIGLDYHYPETDKEAQMSLFAAQLSLAGELGLPVVIHDRDAHGDMMQILSRYKSGEDIPGVLLHCYSGSAEMARQYADMGFYFSFGGVLTYKNAAKARAAAAAVPRTRILLETDCPYLAPEPHRGRINYSGYMRYTAAALGNILGISADEAAKLTSENAMKYYSISRIG